MSEATLDVVGIGNAIVDLIDDTDDAFLARHGMAKGGMALIDEGQAEAIYAAMGPAKATSGGSAGNTIAGLASLGARCGYIGKVRDDQLGKVFRHDITAAGVSFPTPSTTDGPATARCLILVTPDAQRTMNTFLGACVDLRPEDIDEALISSAKITYLEGYLYDPPHAQEAFRKAAAIARAAGRKVSLSLSDSFCVMRHREAFLHLLRSVDVLFANEAELTALFETDDFDAAVELARGQVALAAVTRGAAGAVIVSAFDTVTVPAAPVAKVVDTTGAGDLFAAGFLFGLTRDLPLAECGRLGTLAAAEIISHYGGRPETPLAEYVNR
ncbi:MAG TPA: adenosine kinase [Caulobacteraceae bacterium]|jgi:sugar/nucleoside kinase (ribokinase family)|nr:adenosine kinase [Caulobacteraceae bacterium]